MRRKIKITNLLAFAILLCAVMMAFFPSLFTSYDPLQLDPIHRLQGVSPEHICGTDEYGRDVWARVVYGARNSLAVGFGAAFLAMVVGVPIGLAAGWTGGLADSLIMRIMDAIQSFPAVLLAILIMTILPASALTLLLTIGIVNFPYFARIVRNNVLYIKETEYVEATRAFGAGSLYLQMQTILPNCVSAIVVQFSLLAGSAVLLEAGLSFLGLGLQPPAPAWGSMLSYAQGYIDQGIHYLLAPTLAIFLLVLSINTCGDALRDWLDPKSRRR